MPKTFQYLNNIINNMTNNPNKLNWKSNIYIQKVYSLFNKGMIRTLRKIRAKKQSPKALKKNRFPFIDIDVVNNY